MILIGLLEPWCAVHSPDSFLSHPFISELSVLLKFCHFLFFVNHILRFFSSHFVCVCECGVLSCVYRLEEDDVGCFYSLLWFCF